MVEFRILSEGNKAKSRIMVLDIKGEISTCLGIFLQGSVGDGPRDKEDHLLLSSITPFKLRNSLSQLAGNQAMVTGVPDKTQVKKGQKSYWELIDSMDFLKTKSWLAKLIALYDEMTGFVDKTIFILTLVRLSSLSAIISPLTN